MAEQGSEQGDDGRDHQPEGDVHVQGSGTRDRAQADQDDRAHAALPRLPLLPAEERVGGEAGQCRGDDDGGDILHCDVPGRCGLRAHGAAEGAGDDELRSV